MNEEELLDELDALTSENLELRSRMESKDRRLDELEKEVKRLNAMYEEQLKIMRGLDFMAPVRAVRPSDNEMQNSNDADFGPSGLEQDLISNRIELFGANLELEQYKMRLDDREDLLESKERDVLDLKKENESISRRLSVVNRKLDTSYTASELSDYVDSVITDFNSKAYGTDTAKYIINGVDLDVKAHVLKEESGNVLLSSADLSSDSEASMSSIKISVRAIPK